MTQRIIDITETPQGLKISLLDKQELQDLFLQDLNNENIWAEILEPFSTNGSYSLIAPENIGSLTESPIIASEPLSYYEGADIEYLSKNAKVWWFPNYMVENELVQLLETGETYATPA